MPKPIYPFRAFLTWIPTGLPLVLLLLVFSLEHTTAQNYFTVASTSYRFTPTHYADNKLEKFQIHSNITHFDFPLDGEAKLRPYVGGRYEYTFLSSEVLDMNAQNRFTKIRLLLGGIYSFSPQSELSVRVIPALLSDMEDLSGSDFQWAGECFVNQYINHKISITYGAEYRRTAFGNYLQLLLGANAKLGHGFDFDCLWPYKARLNFDPGKDFNFGIEYNYQLDTYRFAEFLENDYLRKDERRISAYAEAQLLDEIVAFAKAGFLVEADYKVYDESQTYTEVILPKSLKEKIAEPYHKDFANSITFELGIAYRLRMKANEN